MGVTGAATNYMDAVVEHANQMRSRVMLDMLNIQRTSVEVQAKPLRPIGPTGNIVDAFA